MSDQAKMLLAIGFSITVYVWLTGCAIPCQCLYDTPPPPQCSCLSINGHYASFQTLMGAEGIKG